jgi:hypothetical protein
VSELGGDMSNSSKRRKVTAEEGASSNTFTLRIARSNVIDVSDELEVDELDIGMEEESAAELIEIEMDEEFDPNSSGNTNNRTSKRGSRASTSRRGRGRRVGTDESAEVSLSSAAASANNRQAAAARASLEEDEEDVYVDVLDDTEDKQG